MSLMLKANDEQNSLPTSDSRFYCTLRRAATALLVFSILKVGHADGLLGMFVALTIMCAPSSFHLSRAACRIKTASVIAGGFAFVMAIGCVVLLVRGTPQRIGHKVEKVCIDMPNETFAWGKQVITDMSKSDDHYRDEEDATSSVLPLYTTAKGYIRYKFRSADGITMLNTTGTHTAIVTDKEQAQFCAGLKHAIGTWGAILISLGAIVEFALCASAMIVAKKFPGSYFSGLLSVRTKVSAVCTLGKQKQVGQDKADSETPQKHPDVAITVSSDL